MEQTFMMLLIIVVNFLLFLLISHQVHDTSMLFYVHTLCILVLAVPFPKKIKCTSIGCRSRCHFFGFVTQENMLYMGVQFYLVFGIANIFRDKNKLSQTLNIIQYKILSWGLWSVALTVATVGSQQRWVQMPSWICSPFITAFCRHLPANLLYFLLWSKKVGWAKQSWATWGVREDWGEKRRMFRVCICFSFFLWWGWVYQRVMLLL